MYGSVLNHVTKGRWANGEAIAKCTLPKLLQRGCPAAATKQLVLPDLLPCLCACLTSTPACCELPPATCDMCW